MTETNVENTIQIIKELVSIPSPSGNTFKVIDYVQKWLKNRNISSHINNKGSLFVTIEGEDKTKHRVLTAHVDTLGAMVKEVKSDGRLRLSMIGGFKMECC